MGILLKLNLMIAWPRQTLLPFAGESLEILSLDMDADKVSLFRVDGFLSSFTVVEFKRKEPEVDAGLCTTTISNELVEKVPGDVGLFLINDLRSVDAIFSKPFYFSLHDFCFGEGRFQYF